MFLISLNRVA